MQRLLARSRRRMAATLRIPLRGEVEKILQDQVAVLRRDAFGMELHAVHRQRCVRQSHHQPVVGFRRHRKRIWKDLTRCKNRIKGMLAFSGIDIPEPYDNANWSHNFINWLKELDCRQASRRRSLDYMIAQMEYLRKQLLQISNDIRKMMREQRYNTNYYLLRSIPGIGPLTAASILVEIGDVKRFADFYHLNSFVGLLPMEHSSGESTLQSTLTVRKHRQLRSDLVESAWTAKRTDPAMALFFQEQIKRKDSKIVIIKIARKLLSRIRYVLVNQQPYEFGIIK